MILPETYGTALLLTLVSMICWGSWANTFKLAGKWRFELFYYDYSLGVLIAATIYALTFGNVGYDGFTLIDDLMHAGKRQIFYGALGGVVFNLANMLLVAAISVAGLAVAFPVGIGLALVIGVVWNYILKPQGNPALLFGGAAIVVAAIIVDALAYRALEAEKAARAPIPPPKRATKADVKPTARKVSGKGIILSLVSGVLMGSFFPLVEMGKAGDLGLGPYSIGLVFAVGVFVSTFVFNLFFMNLPVEGPPVAMFNYFKGTRRQHMLGIVGGLIWATGTIANFVAASAPEKVQVGPAISYAIGQGATMVSALWGLLVWKEFAGAAPRVRVLVVVMLILFLCGLTIVSIAPLYAR
ncbi:MAG: putative integral rane protein [Bryobacterales bacterium]|nr:putative integral rane protein [Bryobacterales bacterium]